MTLHEDLAADLRSRIVTGALAVGAVLPSESKLCAAWGVSRGPVRQALATLRAEGLIGGGRGAPPTVRSRQLAQPLESLVSFTGWARNLGRTPGQRTAEVARRPASDAVADALNIEPGEPVVGVVRLRLLDGEPTMLERSSFPLSFGLPLLTSDLDRHSVYELLTAAGAEPAAAHHTFDAVAADDVDALQLAVPPATPLLRERRHTRLATGQIIEYSDDRYRPDLVTFTVFNTEQASAALARTWSSHAH